MGQSISSDLLHREPSLKKRSFLVTPKKLIRLRSKTACENSGTQQDECTQTHFQGESDYQETADGYEQATKTNRDVELHPQAWEPVFSNRHKETTHTHATVEASKHNETAAFSHHPTTKDESSLIEESAFLQKLRDLIENLLCGGDSLDGDIVIEIDSTEKTLKILPHHSSSLVKAELDGIQQSPSLTQIIIREHATSSSCDTIFTDAISSLSPFAASDRNNNFVEQNLTITEVVHVDIASATDAEHNDSINVNETDIEKQQEEMPIVKKNLSTNGQQDAGDKGIFNVSRIKKVELSEIPLASDICSNTAPSTVPEQQPQNVSTPKISSNGSGSKVLHRVITLTTASHNNNSDNNNFTKQTKPAFIPEKLHFSAYEKFEGQMLINWFMQSVSASLTTSLNESDLNALTMQYCTNLLNAAIIKPLDMSNGNEIFKSNVMYQWTNSERSKTSNGPGKLETSGIWSNNNSKITSPTKRTTDGESKIPKPVSNFTSTPKTRLQANSMGTPETSLLLNGTESDQSLKITELKNKLSKCETLLETLNLIRSFLSEYTMQSSESSSNSGSIAMTNSLINGSEPALFDKGEEIFNLIQQQQKRESSATKTPVTTRTRGAKSRTSPSTPTGLSNRNDTTRRFRRNLSVDSVSTPSVLPTNKDNSNSRGLCKKCMLISPARTKTTTTKRYVDKATVMDVEPIVMEKRPEMKSIEIQTEHEEDEKNKGEAETEDKKTEIPKNVPIPPPPPLPPNLVPTAPIPPPPPPMMCPPKPPAPPLPPPGPPGAPNVPNLQKGPCPLPPPISLAQPGKLQNSTQPSNTSSSTANGHKPKPLPLPASDFYQTNTLRKNAVNPPKPMKPLYWTRIVAPIIPASQDTTDGTASPDDMSDKDELWKEIDETNLDNLDEFTELFSRQGVVPKALKEAASAPKKIKAIKILDSKRSQNVGIFVRSIHVDFAEIEHAIYNCDTSVVSQETLQNIMAIRATNEELSMIKEAIAAYNGDDKMPPLDAPEHFLLKISEISSSAERISCIVFQDDFEEHMVHVSRKVHVVMNLCDFLLENEHLKEVFSIILTLGNFMNGGNRQRGQADGFGLEILGKLKDVKSKDPKITLLHFIVKTYIARCRKNGCDLTSIELPIPDPHDVDKSLSIDFGEVKEQLKALVNKVEECKKTTEKVITASAPEHVQPFKDKMESFLTMATKKIESRFQKVEECKVVFIKTIKFYKYMPKSGNIDETTPAQFFEYWTSFTSDFNEIFRKEILMLTNELIKKSRQQTKPQSKPATGENNLKARINRLRNRDK